MNLLLAFLLLVTFPMPKQLRGDRLKDGSLGVAGSSVAVHGNRIGKRATFHAQEADGENSTEPDSSPTQASTPSLFDRDDVKRAALDAWTATGHGKRNTESGFFISGSPTGYVVVPHPFTNENAKITTNLAPSAEAEVHVHPNWSKPEPSDADKRTADMHKIDVYTVSRNGIYAYRPVSKTTEFLGPLDKFLETKKSK